MSSGSISAVAGFVLLCAQGQAANAAELKVMAGAAMSGLLGELGPQFERATGHTLVIEYGLGPALKRQIEAGATFDLVILSRALIDDLIKQGKIAAATRAEIARAGVGVAVRSGAPKPDISSVDAFKRALLDAESITYVLESTTGIHLAKVFDGFGLREQMKAKTKPQQVPERVPQAVAGGEAELGLALTSVLTVRGVEIAGLLPLELQNFLVFTAGVGTAARQPDGAKALIKHLTAPEAIPVIRAKGWERVTQ